MNKLFMFYLGGSIQNANIEVHDVQFAVGTHPEDAFSILVERWYGDRNSLHIDAYAHVDWADGYDVSLSPAPPKAAEKLYFVNMGGYVPGDLQEHHKFDLFVARSENEAKQKAKSSLLIDLTHRHRDNQMEVDECLALNQVQGMHIHLTPNASGTPIKAAWQGYKKIGV